MNFNTSITELIQRRYSCRNFLSRPVDPGLLRMLADFSEIEQSGPFGNLPRLNVVAAPPHDSKILRGLGTYGFIKNPAGFIIGAAQDGGKNLEDFGYLMEKIILYATDLGLGTCWLGGTFTKSGFAKRISLAKNEIIPAVTAFGYIAPNTRIFDQKVRQFARSDQRRPWDRLFYHNDFAAPLTEQDAGEFSSPLEMVRIGPSASNKQPWQIVKVGDSWHFYLRRTPGYRDSTYSKILGFADLQRIDMGIAMCHFELTARELGLYGKWEIREPPIELPTDLLTFTASWVSR